MIMSVMPIQPVAARPAKAPMNKVILATLGSILAIACLSLLNDWTHVSLMLGSFGATCVLIFAFPELPFSQPRHVVGGHVLGVLMGLICLTLFGDVWWAMSLAVGAGVAAMMLTGTVHPPAGANPLIVFLIQPDWTFLLYPTFIGAVLLVMVAWLYHRVTKQHYPVYW
jgi:CBS-domain-containing membrane protein